MPSAPAMSSKELAELIKSDPANTTARFAYCDSAVAKWIDDRWTVVVAKLITGAWSLYPGLLVDGKDPFEGTSWTEVGS